MKMGINLFEYLIKLVRNVENDCLLVNDVYEEIFALIQEFESDGYCDDLPIASIVNMIDENIEDKKNGAWRNAQWRIFKESILCLMIMHQKSFDESYEKLIESSPILYLIKLIMEDNSEDEFTSKYEATFVKIENTYLGLDTFAEQDKSFLNLLDFSMLHFCLMVASIKFNRLRSIDEIFKQENLSRCSLRFPKNIKHYEGSEYATLKFLQNGFEDTVKHIPESWITNDVFEKFLNSRIRPITDNNIEINVDFLNSTTTHNYQQQLESTKHEDSFALQYIVDHQNFKDLILHPVIVAYINLKNYRFKRIYEYNFWIYVLQLIIFAFYVTCDEDSGWRFLLAFLTFIPGLLYMSVREFLQLKYINKLNYRKHFSSFSNVCEILLIFLLPITVLIVSHEAKFYPYFIAFILLLMVNILVTVFPYNFMYFHMRLLKKAALTFVKFFFTFFSILCVYALIFMIIFKKSTFEKPENDSAEDEQRTTIENFSSLKSSGMKVILMLSGEYSIEPYILGPLQTIFFSSFVILTFILFNLITGLTIDDVQKMRTDTKEVVVLNQIDRIIKTRRILHELNERVPKFKRVERFGFLKQEHVVNFINFFIAKYPHLQCFKSFYVNVKDRRVGFVEMRKTNRGKSMIYFKFESKILGLEKLFLKYYRVDGETFSEIIEISKSQKS